ncbi:hypothetical protein Sste5346_007399 [Sporothrix stenoceras]|uniref:Duf1237 domain-containing protein n=1 Tax=Sporothrix stenoceras TaxID=5173 RepID=A0ABR3YVJ5_9PEZI
MKYKPIIPFSYGDPSPLESSHSGSGIKSWFTSRWHNPRWRRFALPRIGALLVSAFLFYSVIRFRHQELEIISVQSTADDSNTLLDGSGGDASEAPAASSDVSIAAPSVVPSVSPIVEQPASIGRPPPVLPPPVSKPFNKVDDSNYPGGCMPFMTRLSQKPGPLSEGKRHLPYVRPPPQCRTFNLSSLETLIDDMRTTVQDPDLFRLFENSFPNTLDTMIKWYGYANETDPETKEETTTDEELTYIITGDIDAMWLRDSAAQLSSYSSLLETGGGHDDDDTDDDTPTLARLWRGLINMQARYVLISPYCHSFQPPRESGIPPTRNGAYAQNHPMPPYDRTLVFDCKWELDSLAYFLDISATYFEKTGDIAFFGKYNWVDAVEAAVDAAGAMREGTYDADGHVLKSGYTFTGWTDRGSETLTNNGLGNPSLRNGMVRTAFRPSDDATIFQFLVPANIQWAASLERAHEIMARLASYPSSPNFSQEQIDKAKNLTTVMHDFARGIRQGIAEHAVVHHRKYGDIFAYEVDGYGSTNLMDDANIPSLLSIPLLGFLKYPRAPPKAPWTDKDGIIHKEHDYYKIYENTRQFALSPANPYYAWATPDSFASVGGPHLGPGRGWPMASIVAALTTYRVADMDDPVARNEVVALQINMLLNSTFGAGVMHESIDTWAPHVWTRPWFGWANGLFGELILTIAKDDQERPEEERLLSRSWQ